MDPKIEPWKKGIKKETTIDKLIEAIVRKKLGLTNDYKPIVNHLQDEFIFTVEHLGLVTANELSSLKIPLLIKVILEEYCKQEPEQKSCAFSVPSFPSLNISDGIRDFKSSNNAFAKTERNQEKRLSSKYLSDTGDEMPILITDEDKKVVLEVWNMVKTSTATNNGESVLSQFYNSTWSNWIKHSIVAKEMYEEKNFKEKAEHLMKMMAVIIKATQDSESFSELLERVAIPHCIINLNFKSYETLSKAIVDALETSLGSTIITSDVKNSWGNVINFVSKKILDCYDQIKEGYEGVLLKKTGSSWKSVHTKLTDKSLYLYKDNDMKKIIDKIFFSQTTEFGGDTDCEDSPNEFGFYIKKGNHRITFFAKTKQSYETWIQNINWRVKYAQEVPNNEFNSKKKNVSFLRSKKEVFVKSNNSLLNQIKGDRDFRLFDGLSQPIVITNEKGIIEYANHSILEITNYESKDLIGANVKILLPESIRDFHDHYISTYLQTEVKKVIGVGRLVQLRASGGELHNCHLTVTENLTSGRRIFIGMFQTSDLESSGSESNLEGYLNFSVFDNFLNAVIIIGISGVVIYMNSAAESLTGYSSKKLIGLNVSRIMPHKESQQHDQYIKNYLVTGEKKVIDKTRVLPVQKVDGSIVDCNFQVIEHMAGNTKHFISTLSETHKETLESFLSTQKEVLSSLHIPIIVITEDGIVRLFNKQASHTFGYKSKNIIGKNINTMMPKDVSSKHNTYINNFMTSKKPKIIGKGRIVQVKCQDGSIKTCHLTVSYKNSRDISIFIGMIAVVYNTDYSDE